MNAYFLQSFIDNIHKYKSLHVTLLSVQSVLKHCIYSGLMMGKLIIKRKKKVVL